MKENQKKGFDKNITSTKESLLHKLASLREKNESLRTRDSSITLYLRQKIDQLLKVMGTLPLKTDELDDEMLISLDPIGIISDSFVQILEHLREKNIDLQLARDEIRVIFDSVGAGILVLDESGNILEYNQKMQEIFCTDDLAEVYGYPCREIICGGDDHDSEDHCIIKKVIKEESTVSLNNWNCCDRSYDVVGTPILDNEGDISRIVILYSDITERTKAEKDLRKSEERYRDLFNSSSELIQSVSPDGTILYVNLSWRDKLGYSKKEVSNLTIWEVIHPDNLEQCSEIFREALAGKDQLQLEAAFLSKNGNKILVQGNVSCKFEDGKPVSIRGIFRDITDEKRMRADLIRAHKLESTGLLAGGIAHDFNNLLTGILGNISLAKFDINPGNEAFKLLTEAENACLRSKDLTQQLLTFSKGGAPIKKTANLTKIIEESCSFVLSGSSLNCKYNFTNDVLAVDADQGQLSQVIQNLVLNAAEAMPEGGNLKILGKKIVAADDILYSLKKGTYVKISVQDQGMGIPKKYIEKIFDPYFTTKQKGSGLGLAVSYSIIKNHGGLLTVESELGQGTTFNIFLPASQKKIPVSEVEKKHHANTPVKGRKILLMDDEEIIHAVAGRMLTRIGCEVICAIDGQEAVNLYKKALEAGDTIDAVIMDLTIPGGMGGKEAVHEVLKLDPKAKVLVSSGYSNDPVMSDFQNYGFCGIITKPYEMEELRSAVIRTFDTSDT